VRHRNISRNRGSGLYAAKNANARVRLSLSRSLSIYRTIVACRYHSSGITSRYTSVKRAGINEEQRNTSRRVELDGESARRTIPYRKDIPAVSSARRVGILSDIAAVRVSTLRWVHARKREGERERERERECRIIGEARRRRKLEFSTMYAKRKARAAAGDPRAFLP